MRRHATIRCIMALLIAGVGGCTRSLRAPDTTPTVSGDSLGELLISRMDLRPRVVELRLGQRITVEFTSVPWADSSDSVRFDRAYDVAHLLWTSYGAAHAIDTISIRRATPGPGGAAGPPAHVEEFYFYPEQLTARQRPRMGRLR